MHYEQHVSVDDNILPDAAELEKLKQLDPDIIAWIKSRAEKEQDARIDFNKQRVDVLKRTTRTTFRIDIYVITCALTVILAGMAFSAYLIYMQLPIYGTIFGGGVILLMANAFLKLSNHKKSNKP